MHFYVFTLYRWFCTLWEGLLMKNRKKRSKNRIKKILSSFPVGEYVIIDMFPKELRLFQKLYWRFSFDIVNTIEKPNYKKHTVKITLPSRKKRIDDIITTTPIVTSFPIDMFPKEFEYFRKEYGCFSFEIVNIIEKPNYKKYRVMVYLYRI